MFKESAILRVDILRSMNNYIMHIGDEDITDNWTTYGVPDEPTEEDYLAIAEDTELFCCVCRMFARLVKWGDSEC